MSEIDESGSFTEKKNISQSEAARKLRAWVWIMRNVK